jgi:UDP-N-acetylmuramate--alanine ligase
VVSSVDPDHLDIYETHAEFIRSFATFIGQTRENGVALLAGDVEATVSGSFKIYRYGFENTDIICKIVSSGPGYQDFSVEFSDIRKKPCKLSIPGSHNVLNATAASAACLLAGIPENLICSAMESYQGVRRRFDYRILSDDIIYIDDYAHHPEEIRACIKAIREVHPGKRITGIFQPHLYSRTRDFAAEFAESLESLDEIILLGIYPAREEPIPGISSLTIFEKIKNPAKLMAEKDDLMDLIRTKEPEVLLTIGAGDIDQFVEPIENLLRGRMK